MVNIMAIELQPAGRFGTLLHTTLNQRDLSLRDLAKQIDSTYEHMRKLIRGLTYPSRYLLKELCAYLQIKEVEASKAILADRIQHKYGKMPAILAGKNPELDEIEKDWLYLEDWMKEAVNSTVKGFARQARENALRG